MIAWDRLPFMSSGPEGEGALQPEEPADGVGLGTFPQVLGNVSLLSSAAAAVPPLCYEAAVSGSVPMILCSAAAGVLFCAVVG